MKNFWKITLIILVFVILTSPFLLKFKNIDEKIKLTRLSFSYPKNFDDFKNLLTDYFITNVNVTLSNYSEVEVPINQIKLNLYTLKDNLFVEQSEPIKEGFKIAPKSNTTLEIPFQIYYADLVELFEDNYLKKELPNRLLNLGKYFKLSTQVKAKGFAEVGALTITFDTILDI
ncbi:MAG: hypothetical protein JXR68_14155 [Bacteroidales bacterium]|nr:hypothetical protein [Bacteroidales bacterium]